MNIRKLVLLTAAMMLLVFSSCKKETVDVTDLLTTVPSSAGGVIVFNLESMLEDAGCKIKDHSVTPSPEVLALIEKSSPQDKKGFMMLFEGNSGIEPKGAVVFYDSNRTYLTFALYDVAKFCEFVEMQDGMKFGNEEDGVKIAGNVAVKGAQAWVCLNGNKRLDSDVISSYSGLNSSQSFLVTPMGESLLVSEKDIRGWALLKTMMNEMLDRYNRNVANMAQSFLFEDAESLKFEVDFEKGKIESEAMLMNEKFKPAKYQLPAEKIDIKTLKDLGSTCDAMMAFTVTPKLIKKFDQLGNAFGGALFGDLGDMFKNIDGTVGVIASGEGVGESLQGVITTKGDVSQSLRDMISKSLAPISIEGKLLKFSKGDVKGALSVEECADLLKGSCFGIVLDASGLNSVGYAGNPAMGGYKELCFRMSPESGGLEFEFEITLQDSNENSLLRVLKTM
ncbi:MAG: hypothetical protein J1F12_01230 [Muribaculaceae bacterium]|nr:hypothetical protein [Muribaculaceae bacterium]